MKNMKGYAVSRLYDVLWDDGDRQVAKPRYSAAHLLLFSRYSETIRGVFLTNAQESLASVSSDIILNCCRSATPHSVLFATQDGELVARVGGENGVSVLQPRTDENL